MERPVIRVDDNGNDFPEGMSIGEDPLVGSEPDAAGVGLAIVQEIVRSHGGSMLTEKSKSLSGASIAMRFRRE